MAVDSVASLHTSLDVILEHRIEYIYCLIGNYLILQRYGNLHTSLGISGHKVCGRNIYLPAFALAENIDTAVFEETSDYRNDRYVFGVTRHSCDKTADASYYQFYLYSLTACLYQLVYNNIVGERVHFKADIAVSTVGYLVVDHFHNA